jgi:hypothetical protein
VAKKTVGKAERAWFLDLRERGVRPLRTSEISSLGKSNVFMGVTYLILCRTLVSGGI